MFNTLPPRSSGASANSDFPFKVFIIGNKTDGFKRGVYYNSKLFQTISYKSKKTITGLLTSLTPTDKDDGYTPTEKDDFIWLEIEVYGPTDTPSWPTIKTASIKSKKKDGASAFGGGEVERDNGTPLGSAKAYTQTKARIVLAVINESEDNPEFLTVDQRVSTNLRMEQCIMTALYNDPNSTTEYAYVPGTYPYPV